MPPRGYGRKPPSDDQPTLAASGKELLEAAMTANSADDAFSFAPNENEDIGERSDGSEHDFFQPLTPSRRNITDLNFSPTIQSTEESSSAVGEGEEYSVDAQSNAKGPAEDSVAEANNSGRAGVTMTEFEEDVDTEEEYVCGIDEDEDEGKEREDGSCEADGAVFEEEANENVEGLAVTADENTANEEDAEEMVEDHDASADKDRAFEEGATESTQGHEDTADEGGAFKQGSEEESEERVDNADEDLDAASEKAREEVTEEVARESDEEEDACSEDILDIVQECLTELGSEILKMTVKQIIAKVESSSGTDLSEWKKAIKKVITNHASSLYSQPDATSREATPVKGAGGGAEGEASDAEVDVKEVDEEGAGSEYEDSDDSENEGKPKGRMKKNGAKKAAGKPSKATLEELEAVKEEEEVRAKNQAMVEMLQGDALERKEQTNARLAALREKIRLKCSDEQAKRLNRAAAQLKTIKAAERNSPDSAAGFCAQAFSREPPKKVLPAARSAPVKKWGGLSHSPKKPDRRALRARLMKQRVYKAGEFFTQTNDDTGMTSEKYLMMLKEDDLQKQVKIKAALERKAQEAEEDIFAHEDEMSDDEGEAGSEEEDEEDEGANAGVHTADVSEGSLGEDAVDDEDNESVKPAASPEQDGEAGEKDQGADDGATVDGVEIEATPVEEGAVEKELEASHAANDELAVDSVGVTEAAAAVVAAPAVVAPAHVAPPAVAPAVPVATVAKQRLDASGALSKAPLQIGIMAAFFNKPRKVVEQPKEEVAESGTKNKEITATQEVEASVKGVDENDTQIDEAMPGVDVDGGEEGGDEKDANEEDGEEEEEEEEEEKVPVDRTAAYKAELAREAKALKAGRRARKGGLLDEEAEEEEEEAEVAGLGDFGFAVAPKASGANGGEEEDEKVVADEDDFRNIVDDLSDGEGDEEAGNQARALKNASEDQNDLLEMKRRLKEGNLGGRRGGRQDARGNFREDQLMGIDLQGKKDLRKVGLTTASDDEGDDSGGEGGGLNSEDELDQAIKARHGRQESRFDDEGSDDDEDDDNEYANDGSAFSAAVALDDEAREERDAARAARRWEKQVKMRRVLSEVGGDRSQGVHDEESQSMLTMLKRSISNPTPKAPSKLMRQSSFSAGGAGSAPGSLPSSLAGAAPSAAAAAMARRMAAPLSIRPFPGAAHPLGARKGSFVDKKRIVPTSAGGRTGTVSNQRFVFGAAGVPASNESDSQSQSGNAWSEHLKRQAPAQGAQEGARKPTMNTAVYSFLAANRFKKAKSS